MPFVSRPQSNPVAPPRATKNTNSATFDKTSKLATKLNSSAELERPATPVPQQALNVPQAAIPQGLNGGGAMIPTAPQMNRFDDPMNGFGYGYGFGQGWGAPNSFGFGGMGYGGYYAAGMNAFAPDVVAPSAYYDSSNDATFFANGNQQFYNMYGGGYYGGQYPQQQPTVYNQQFGNAPTYAQPQQQQAPTITPSGFDYQSLYGSTPDYFGGMSTQYFNAIQSQQNALTRQPSSIYPTEMEPRAATTVFSSQASIDGESLFGGLRARSQSQPILRRSSTSPLTMNNAGLMMPVQPSLAPWEEVFLQHQGVETQSVAPTMASTTATTASSNISAAYVTPWGTTVQAQPRAQTPPPAMMAQMWSSGSTTSWSNESVSKMVRTEVVKFGQNLATRVKTELHDAFVLHPTRAPMAPKTWDSSRPKTYEYRPCERTIEENGVPVCSVQYLEDGTAFNLVVNGERLGAVVRNPTTTLRNPFKDVGPRRGDDWLVVDRNRQTRYRIQRRPKNYYELVVLLGAQTAMSVHQYSCNWYNAITTGVLSVFDRNGQVVGSCQIGADTTGSQMDRRMTMSCAQGCDHPTVLSTMLLGLELARVYSNEAIHPSNQNNRGKATMGFGPSVTPHLFYM